MRKTRWRKVHWKSQTKPLENENVKEHEHKVSKRKLPPVELETPNDDDIPPTKLHILENDENVTHTLRSRKIVDADVKTTIHQFNFKETPCANEKLFAPDSPIHASTDPSECPFDDNTASELQKWTQKFNDTELLTKLFSALFDVELHEDFYTLMTTLANKIMPIRNLPLLTCLERAKFAKCTTTTLMRFYPETKAFYRVAYLYMAWKRAVVNVRIKKQGSGPQ